MTTKTKAKSCIILPNEREFMWTWTRTRSLDDVYAVLASTIWIRIKDQVALFSFSIRSDSVKEVYLIVCIHIAMKYLGYDEVFRCNFVHDLVQVSPTMDAHTHQRLEFEVLHALDWTIEDLKYE
ncbi:FirrV-1-I3 [Feldmannia irregularis virus a]|uniref:FirrV-1-I3 n=1 Tax=Feldmannia irregularis virus a TaxID=231992 RepID=Q6XLU3_9PHYC|nr:FirrV-1-I3 [Feldmannia irregularis virus a]AAR26968.1 FirrV-1-I3 [Feldmannia irregularis virus a]